MRILIIGGGIGGLSFAAALRKAGLQYQVYEQAKELGEVGAGLGLWSNAIRCLERIGIEPDYWNQHGIAIQATEIGTPKGKVLSRLPVSALADEFGAHSYVVHRADLHCQLARLIPAERISLGHRCTGIEQAADQVVARFANGEMAHGDLLVGADGLRSFVRSDLFGFRLPRYSGQTCYRGIAGRRLDEPHVLREVQGAGLRAAVCALADDRVYWWATENAPRGQSDDPLARKRHLQDRFVGWRFGFPEALQATDPACILRNDLFDRPSLKRWSKQRLTLLGDAAHPTTPNLGQGACMAIQDGIVLAHFLATCDDHNQAFRLYEQERMKRCYRIVRQSQGFGWIGGWKNPAAVRLRESLIALTPNRVLESMLRDHIGYCFPADATTARPRLASQTDTAAPQL